MNVTVKVMNINTKEPYSEIWSIQNDNDEKYQQRQGHL